MTKEEEMLHEPVILLDNSQLLCNGKPLLFFAKCHALAGIHMIVMLLWSRTTLRSHNDRLGTGTYFT